MADRTIGEINVKLSASTAKFHKDMEHASASLHAFEKQIHSITHIATGFFAGWTAGKVIETVFEKALHAGKEAELNLKHLESVLEATEHAAGLSSEQIERFALGLQETTRFSKEATVGAATLLATFTSVKGDNFRKALVAIQDIAEIKGLDLNTVAQAVGKALEAPADSFGKLKKFGIVLDKQTQQSIKSLVQMGDIVGAQTKLLDAFNARFGGSAVNAVDTYSGAISRLNNAVEEMSETFGKSFAPAIAEVANQLHGLFNSKEMEWALFLSGQLASGKTFRQILTSSAIHAIGEGMKDVRAGDKDRPTLRGALGGLGFHTAEPWSKEMAKTFRNDAFGRIGFQPVNKKLTDSINNPGIFGGIKQIVDELKKIAEKLGDKTRTPEQEFNKNVNDLQRAFKAGEITLDELEKGIAMSARDMLKGHGGGTNEALMAGSAEAITARYQAEVKQAEEQMVRELVKANVTQNKQLMALEATRMASEAAAARLANIQQG